MGKTKSYCLVEMNRYIESPEEIIRILFGKEGATLDDFNSYGMSIFDLKYTKVIYQFGPRKLNLIVNLASPNHICGKDSDLIRCDCHWLAFSEAPTLRLEFTKAEVKKILTNNDQLKLAV